MRKSNKELKPPVGLAAGVFAGTAAAVMYTMSNIALRDSIQINPFLVSAVKAAPTVICLSPFLVWMLLRGQTIYTSLHMAPRFIAVALLGQFVGNAAFQWALGSIGLAASVPITLGTLLIGGAILGRIILKEPVRPRSMIAIGLLIVAVVVLSTGGENEIDASKPVTSTLAAEASNGELQTPSVKVVAPWIGAICAGASGIAYALFGTVMRQAMSQGLSPALTMWISGMVGTLSLWSVTWFTVDASEWSVLTTSQWRTMGIAGVFNFTAFIALSLALKALPVVAVNLINASQVAMAAVAGIVLFGEKVTLSLIAGITLTFVGLLVLASRKKQRATIAMEDGVALVDQQDAEPDLGEPS